MAVFKPHIPFLDDVKTKGFVPFVFLRGFVKARDALR